MRYAPAGRCCRPLRSGAHLSYADEAAVTAAPAVALEVSAALRRLRLHLPLAIKLAQHTEPAPR